MVFVFIRAAGARATRDQVSATVGPSVQSHARTPSGSETDAQRGEAQDTIAPGTHQLGEYKHAVPVSGMSRFSFPSRLRVLFIDSRFFRSWPKISARRNYGGKSTRSMGNDRIART